MFEIEHPAVIAEKSVSLPVQALPVKAKALNEVACVLSSNSTGSSSSGTSSSTSNSNKGDSINVGINSICSRHHTEVESTR